eukprot:TRINITY_DN575_c1_g1_i2.p1 TRINITY_DN575_c1_g1~~TRINITY_DN575_c1_g1_i2.p1  ORF type:complete len:1161 (-),score=219.44 TRINITY_DN575_c1_g1_i2:122-3253(-)
MFEGQSVWPPSRSYYASFIDNINGYIYYFGGKADTVLYNDLWRYNIAENSWRELRPRGTRPSPRYGATISVHNDLVYLYGGDTGDDLGSSDMWVFDYIITPGISVMECNDPDNQDGFYSVGDTVDIVFYNSMITYNITSKAEIDEYWILSPNLGADYTGEWVFDDLYRVTILDITGHQINDSTCNVTLEVNKVIYDLDGTEYDIGLKSDDTSGDWGVLVGPEILSAVADDPDNFDLVFSNGDTITIQWSNLTNTPDVATKADIDTLLTFSGSLGVNYTGVWNSFTELVITIVDASGAGTTTIPGLTVTVNATGKMTNLRGDSEFSIGTYDLTGDWGNSDPPAIISIVANDPDDGDTVYSTGDTILITFDTATNKPTIATKADVDNEFTFNTGSLGNDYTAAWNALGDEATITIVDSTGHSSPAIGSLTITCSGAIRNAPVTSAVCSNTSPVISGDWGLGPLTIVMGGTLDGKDEDQVKSTSYTITLTITTADTWVATGGLFEAERQNLIDGLLVTQSGGPSGFAATVRPSIAVTQVVRTSDTIVTITVPATATYGITGNDEIIRAQVPAGATSRGLQANTTNNVTIVDVPPVLSGTLTAAAATEEDIVSGAHSIQLTIVADTWVAAGATFDAERQNLIDTLVASAGAKWNSTVQTAIPVSNVVRTSDTVVTITLPAISSYFLSAGDEIIVCTGIPASALTLGTAIDNVAGTFTISDLGANAAITGTMQAGGVLESEIVSGNQTIIITITNDRWVAAGATFDAQRAAIIAGIVSAANETAGFNAAVSIPVGNVVRTNDRVVTVTLPASAGYSITANETVTATIPASALEGSVAPVGSPTLPITDEDPVATFTGSLVPDISPLSVKSSAFYLVITLANDMWASAGPTFDGQRQGIINGINGSLGSDANRWNQYIRPNISVSSVVRVDDRVVNITVLAHPGYRLEPVDEIITVTVPSAAILGGNGGSGLLASPTGVITGLSICGNGIIEVGEECDDGNVIDGDACSSSCQLKHPVLRCWTKEPTHPLCCSLKYNDCPQFASLRPKI